jgi:ribonuclease E
LTNEPNETAPARTTTTEPAADAPSGDAPRRRRRRGGRGRGGRGGASAARTGGGADESGSDPATSGQAQATVTGAAPAKPQGGRGRAPRAVSSGVPAATPIAEGAPRPESEVTSPGGEAGTAPKRRRRRGGRGRGRGKGASTGAAATTTDADDEGSTGETAATQRDDAAPDADGDAPTTPAGSRRRRRGRGSGASKAPADRPAPEKQPAKAASKTTTLEERIAAGGPTRGIRSSRTRTGRDRRRRREPLAPPPRESDKLMVITENGERDQIAVLENDVLVQHYVTRQGATSMVGNVYLGRVQNVLPGMEAAFVDVGRGRNGVLYAGEVNYSLEDVEGPAPRIEQVLKPGQSVIVQVSKDPMGGKGARLTANLSLAGRYLVLAPDQDLSGISRRLSEDVRKRLKSILKKVKPDRHGVIVRTAAEGATDEQVRDDLERLLREWSEIEHRAKRSKAPAVLYEEPELTVRVVRDLFTDEEFRGLVTDSRRVFDKVMGYVQEIAPDVADKIHLHEGKLPAFEEHRVVEQIQKALERKVWLPSGGYLFIERTEAMTIVDVNTGKSVGKTNLEETVLNTNLEAAREVARQLRLRDIGGIIVIDFIDMLLEKNRGKVEDAMREALAVDKTRSQVFEIGPLGLMQVTRKRVSSGLVESFSETCPTCEGRGILTTYQID